MKRTAVITDIQRSSVHDGPGFRTTVFFKGCQMHCAWCHNPETISPEPQTLFYPEKCIGCGRCEEGCFSGARVLCGREMSVEDVFAQIEQDRPYYGDEGGVTLSGGEPLCQAQFALELIERCRSAGVGCAMESNLSVGWEVAQPVVERLSLLMADLKLWDEAAHRQYTGLDNRLARENLLRAQATGVPLVLRTPVVPGVNATGEEIGQIAAFARGLSNLRYYELLSYHPLGLDKARALGCEIREFDKPTREIMLSLAETARAQGVAVAINGVRLETFRKEG